MLASVGMKVLSGKEDTTLLSMVDRRVKQVTVSTATRYGIKTMDSRVSKGERTHRGSKHPRAQTNERGVEDTPGKEDTTRMTIAILTGTC